MELERDDDPIDNPSPSFEEFLDYQDGLTEFSARVVPDRSTADDLVQDAFLTALERPPQHRDDIRAWLRAVVRNLALREHRSRRRRKHWEAKAASERPEFQSAPEQPGRSVLEAVRAAIEKLPDHYRKPLELRLFSELSARNIAKELNLPLETVKSQLHRGLERLRESLRKDYGEEFTGIALVMALRIHVPISLPPAGSAEAGSPREPGALAPQNVLTPARAFFALLGLLILPFALIWLRDPRVEPETASADQGSQPAIPKLDAPEESLAPTTDGPGAVQRNPASNQKKQESLPVKPTPEESPIPIEVLVRDQDGEMIHGAEVLLSTKQPDNRLEASWMPQGLSDKDGKLTLLVGSQNYCAPYVEKPYVQQIHPVERLGLAATLGERKSGVLWISTEHFHRAPFPLTIDTSERALEVTVTDSNGSPIQAAPVTLATLGNVMQTRSGSAMLTQPLHASKTDSQGLARFPLPAPNYQLVIHQPGFGIHSELLGVLGSDIERRRVVLRKGCTLRGSIEHADGERASECKIFAISKGSVVSAARASMDGTFLLKDMPSEVGLSIEVVHESDRGYFWATAAFELKAGDVKSCKLSFSEPRVAEIRISDSSGKPQSEQSFALSIKGRPRWTGKIRTDAEGIAVGTFDIADEDEVVLRRASPDGGPLGPELSSFTGVELAGGTLELTMPLEGSYLLCDGVWIAGKDVSIETIFLTDPESGTVSPLNLVRGKSSTKMPAGTYRAMAVCSYGTFDLGMVTVTGPGDTRLTVTSVEWGEFDLNIDPESDLALEIRPAGLKNVVPLRTITESSTVLLLAGEYRLRTVRGNEAQEDTRTLQPESTEVVEVSWSTK